MKACEKKVNKNVGESKKRALSSLSEKAFHVSIQIFDEKKLMPSRANNDSISSS